MTFLLDGVPAEILPAWMYEARFSPHPAARMSHAWTKNGIADTCDWGLSPALVRAALKRDNKQGED